MRIILRLSRIFTGLTLNQVLVVGWEIRKLEETGQISVKKHFSSLSEELSRYESGFAWLQPSH